MKQGKELADSLPINLDAVMTMDDARRITREHMSDQSAIDNVARRLYDRAQESRKQAKAMRANGTLPSHATRLVNHCLDVFDAVRHECTDAEIIEALARIVIHETRSCAKPREALDSVQIMLSEHATREVLQSVHAHPRK